MSIRHSALTLIAAASIAALAAGPALAAGGGGDNENPGRDDPNYSAAVEKIEAGDYEGAIPLLLSVVEEDPSNADAFNYLGYSNRKLQRYAVALEHYQKALSLEPRHRGAHEYVGELYLETGNLAKAEEHLDALDSICFFGCDEYDVLKERVEAYREGRTTEQSMSSGWRK